MGQRRGTTVIPKQNHDDDCDGGGGGREKWINSDTKKTYHRNPSWDVNPLVEETKESRDGEGFSTNPEEKLSIVACGDRGGVRVRVAEEGRGGKMWVCAS